MVLSKIDKSIEYNENTKIETTDIEYETTVYLGELYKTNIIFVLGKPNFDKIPNNIIYFNIYLIKNNNIFSKIGIYETNNTIYSTLIDIKSGNVDINELNKPLLFQSSRKIILEKYKLSKKEFNHYFNSINNPEYEVIDPTQQPIKEEDEEDSDEDDSDEDDEGQSEEDEEEESEEDKEDESEEEESEEDKEDEEDEEDKTTTKKSVLPNLAIVKQQSKEESDNEMKIYKKEDSDKWINKAFKSHKYIIKENPGGGHCFFYVLKDALNSLSEYKSKQISVSDIRKKISENATKPIFSTYKEIYDGIKSEYDYSKKELSSSKAKYNVLKIKMSATNDSEEKQNILNEAKINLETISKHSDDVKSLQKSVSLNEFKFMEDVKTFEDFKAVILTDKFWADAWAISLLEKIYNVKFIIFSDNEFKENLDHDEHLKSQYNIVQCGELHQDIQEIGTFNPDHYIMVNYQTDVHYQQILYQDINKKSIFTFKELPYRIKELIIGKCIEKNAGAFYLIPEFKEFALLNKVDIEERPNIESLISQKNNDYNENIIIQIWKNSSDKPIAGGKIGKINDSEYLSTKYFSKYKSSLTQLYKFKNWRRKLEDSWLLQDIDPISKQDQKLEIDGNIWPSVQHYLYAIRFNKNTEPYNKFVKNKDEIITKDNDEAAKFYKSAIKIKKYDTFKITEKEYEGIYNKQYFNALLAKFDKNEELKTILSLTLMSLINIYKPGSKPQKAELLMRLRSQFLTKVPDKSQ